jgi:hypothetical protein
MFELFMILVRYLYKLIWCASRVNVEVVLYKVQGDSSSSAGDDLAQLDYVITHLTSRTIFEEHIQIASQAQSVRMGSAG